jgi:hypothetical protein
MARAEERKGVGEVKLRGAPLECGHPFIGSGGAVAARIGRGAAINGVLDGAITRVKEGAGRSRPIEDGRSY